MTVLFFCTEGHSLALGIRVTRSQKKFLNESIFSSAMTKVHFAPNGTFKRKVDATLKILPRKTQIFFSFHKSILKIIDGALVLFFWCEEKDSFVFRFASSGLRQTKSLISRDSAFELFNLWWKIVFYDCSFEFNSTIYFSNTDFINYTKA